MNINKPKDAKNKGRFAAFCMPVAVGMALSPVGKLIDNVVSKSDNAPYAKTVRSKVNDAFELSGLKNTGAKIINVVDGDVDKNYFDRFTGVIKKLQEPHIKNDMYAALGVLKEIKLINPENTRAFAEYEEALKLKYKRSSKLAKQDKILEKYVVRFCSALDFKTLENGKNSFAFPDSKKIFLPLNKLCMAGYHETGHLIFRNKPAVNAVKVLSRVRYLGFPIFLTGILTRTKTDNKELTPGNKFTNFVRQNAGKLILLTFIPRLFEEAMASHYGNKLAKKVLDTSLYKKVVKFNAVAFSSYLLTAVGAALSVFTAVKVKDAIQARHEAKTVLKT
jgi:hypothetical protein